MKKHTSVYLNFFGFKIPEDCVCEICKNFANDIHHIQARGAGGNPKGNKDQIENLMALCRFHHDKHGDVPNDRQWLTNIHLDYMKENGLKNKYLEYLNRK